jgi:HlyD family secretion protein
MYMTVYLPTDKAGQVALGAEARIVLDALAEQAIPATVSFVAPKAQFTRARWKRAASARS